MKDYDRKLKDLRAMENAIAAVWDLWAPLEKVMNHLDEEGLLGGISYDAMVRARVKEIRAKEVADARAGALTGAMAELEEGRECVRHHAVMLRCLTGTQELLVDLMEGPSDGLTSKRAAIEDRIDANRNALERRYEIERAPEPPQ